MISGLLGLAGATGIITGLVLVLPKSRKMDSSKPLAWLETDLDTPRYFESTIYRHHRITGVALVAAAALWLWLLSPLNAWRTFLTLTWRYIIQLISSGCAATLAAALLGLSVLIVGLLLVIRPSLLKPLEAIANQWLSPFPQTHSTDRNITALAIRYRRITGVLLLTAGITCLYSAANLAGIRH